MGDMHSFRNLVDCDSFIGAKFEVCCLLYRSWARLVVLMALVQGMDGLYIYIYPSLGDVTSEQLKAFILALMCAKMLHVAVCFFSQAL